MAGVTREWAVSVEGFCFGGDVVTEEALLELAALLEPHGGAVGGRGNLATATLTVAADGVARAVREGALVFTEACEKAGLGPPSIVKAEAVTYEALDVDLSEPNFPRLVGVAEIAEILGTSRQRASEVTHKDSFPAPVAELAMGAVWREPDIRRFVAAWERKPGRPRKRSAPETAEGTGTP